MAGHKKEHHEEHIDESWLIPYADLLTLLLALFIVLFASSTISEDKYRAIQEAFGTILNGGEGMFDGTKFFVDFGGSAPAAPVVPKPTVGAGEYEKLVEVEEAIKTYFEEKGIASEIEMHQTEKGLVISLSNKLLFDSGSADIMDDSVEILRTVGNAFHSVDNYIRVEGNTDNVPIKKNAKFISNWELSASRATHVVRLFIQECALDPERLVPVAYGEYRPVASNDTAEGRAQNRRVDIIVLSSKFSQLEGQPSDLKSYVPPEEAMLNEPAPATEPAVTETAPVAPVITEDLERTTTP